MDHYPAIGQLLRASPTLLDGELGIYVRPSSRPTVAATTPFGTPRGADLMSRQASQAPIARFTESEIIKLYRWITWLVDR